MANSNWYKLIGADPNNNIYKTPAKVMRVIDNLDGRLQSVIREQDIEKGVRKRKQAGGTKRPGGKSKKKLKMVAPRLVPRVCSFKKIYDENRQELRRHLYKCQRENNRFQSRPVPNFQKCHQELERRKLLLNAKNTVTRPLTPRFLRASMEALHQRKKTTKATERKAGGCSPKIKRNPLRYLMREPFVPIIQSSFIRTQPFRLYTEERAKSRRIFNECLRRRMQKRWDEQAADNYDRERREYLRLRRLTNFKATPNPWKTIKSGLFSK